MDKITKNKIEMRTLLKTHDCILHSEYRPIEKCKNGDEVLHKNKVESITFFKDKYDYNGNHIGVEKIIVGWYFLDEIRNAINEIENDTKILKYEEHLF